MTEQLLLIRDSQPSWVRAGGDNHGRRMQRGAIHQHVKQLIAFDQADDLILDNTSWLRGDRLPERREGFLTREMLAVGLAGQLLTLAGFAAKAGADQQNVEPFAQPIGRGSQPGWATANDHEIMHDYLLSLALVAVFESLVC